jgi:hypothetical protein
MIPFFDAISKASLLGFFYKHVLTFNRIKKGQIALQLPKHIYRTVWPAFFLPAYRGGSPKNAEATALWPIGQRAGLHNLLRVFLFQLEGNGKVDLLTPELAPRFYGEYIPDLFGSFCVVENTQPLKRIDFDTDLSFHGPLLILIA